MVCPNGSVGAAWAQGVSLREQVGYLNIYKPKVNTAISSGSDGLMGGD